MESPDEQRAPSPSPELPRRRFTVSEYYRMADLGLFVGQHVELVDGEVVEMSPQGAPHAGALSRISDFLKSIAPAGTVTRVQLPLAIDDQFEPEPDVAIVTGTYEDFDAKHPSTALLVLEVAVMSLSYDRDVKPNIYARARVPEYWLVDPANRTVEVFRGPRARRGARFGHDYGETRTYLDGESITPLFEPQRVIPVASLFARH